MEGRLIPDIFRESVFDELFVLELVQTHENVVIACFWASFEVENHRFFLFWFFGKRWRSKKLGFSERGGRDRFGETPFLTRRLSF